MARREADREDIMREALALRRRVAIQVPDSGEPIVCGVRSSGHWSFYLDPNRVYQVDIELRLRRAYVDGCLYRTQGTTLARMHRERNDSETTLVRHDLTGGELTSFLDDMRSHLQRLLDRFRSDEARVIEVIPLEADIAGELQQTLQKLLSRAIELAPAIKA